MVKFVNNVAPGLRHLLKGILNKLIELTSCFLGSGLLKAPQPPFLFFGREDLNVLSLFENWKRGLFSLCSPSLSGWGLFTNSRNYYKFLSLTLILFLQASCGASAYPPQAIKPQDVVCSLEDEKLIKQKIKLLQQRDLEGLSTSEVFVEAAKTFLTTPYVAGTLEVAYPEKLVVNAQGLDCLTFVESSLSLALSLKDKNVNLQKLSAPLGDGESRGLLNAYLKNLEFIRYRAGKMNGYASRLHYFTDWLLDAEQKGLLKLVTGPRVLSKEINLLSKNLKHKEDLQAIKQTEKALNIKMKEGRFTYFACEDLKENKYLKQLKAGDIIGFTSNIEGLDVNHVGILFIRNNKAELEDSEKVTFMQATSVKSKQVEVYPGTLYEYCKDVKANTGIIVGRLNSVPEL
ncbi:MAG TPA: N-acetylmuramoyl-L-alanine amidase-like domain-containing protein [Vampirovibrionales bacterium]